MKNCTNAKIKALKPNEKGHYTLSIGDKLSVRVYESGAISFFFRWLDKTTGIQDSITIGPFPDWDIKAARKEAQKYRTWLARGKNPKEELKRSALLTFECVVRQWHLDQYPEQDKQHALNVIRAFEKHLFPKVGPANLKNIEYSIIDQILGELPTSTSKRLRTNLININLWALERKFCDHHFVFKKRVSHKVKNRAAATTADELRPIIQKINRHHHQKPVCSIANALLMAPMLPVRREDLVSMERGHINLETRLWHLKDSKSGYDVLVPIAESVAQILGQIKSQHESKWMFPGIGEHIAGRSLLNALRDCGVAEEEQDIHGFRATFHTMMGEKGYSYELREMCIAHVGKAYSGAYDRTIRLPEKREIMQVWAQTIGELK